MEKILRIILVFETTFNINIFIKIDIIDYYYYFFLQQQMVYRQVFPNALYWMSNVSVEHKLQFFLLK